MNVDSLVLAMVADVFEEYATSKEADLQGADIDVDPELVPCVQSNGVRNDRREEAVEVEEEPEHQYARSNEFNEPCPRSISMDLRRLPALCQ